MRAAEALVAQLPRTTLVLGKGGVGKTTCAAALALRASAESSTLVLSTDPARALPTVLGEPLGATPRQVLGFANLRAQILDANALRERFLARWGAVIRMILDRGTYLDDADIGPLVDTALPGGDEIFGALALAELITGEGSNAGLSHQDAGESAQLAFATIVVDTAPTGHTLRLLNLPATFRALMRLLDAMQEKHRFMVRALTRAYRADQADAFLEEMTGLVNALDESLRDSTRCGAVMVTNAQPLVLDETRRYLNSLRELDIQVRAIVWNNVDDAVAGLPSEATQYLVPHLEQWPIGKDGLERWLAALRRLQPTVATASAKAVRSRSKPRATDATSDTDIAARMDALLRPLTIVAGKGGVGKTTVSAAIALHASSRWRTLVVSTDPAPSLADALAQNVPDADTPVQGVAQLFARQMDASAAFARMRETYQSRVDALFDALIARGVDLAHDRAIARELLTLAPPGVDEVYALSLLCDALFKDHYARVVVDPAPTGHLLRLLEMPQLALTWTHELMRLILKYKDIAALGDTARDLLDFARSLRALDALLRDESRAGVVIVTLDEPVVRAETERLGAEARKRGVALSALLLNRAERGAALPALQVPVHFQAPAVAPPPMGVPALRSWTATWR